jgi:SAM-dependent methyltransferase
MPTPPSASTDENLAAPDATIPLSDGDYISPNLEAIYPDRYFPNMIRGDAQNHPWPYLRREVGHAWYVDQRKPLMGFMSRDEAVLLYNIGRQFRTKKILEIGCWFGWSTCHLAWGGGNVDVIDPILADPIHSASVKQMLVDSKLNNNVKLHALASPLGVEQIAAQNEGPWSLFVVDGDHEAPGPELDVDACLKYATDDVAFVFHDLASPHVSEALRMLEAKGFHILLYQTMQIMGIAWRGNVAPVHHVPDPAVPWQLPHHLVGLPVSGVRFSGYNAGYVANLRATIAQQSAKIVQQDVALTEMQADYNARLEAAGLRSRLRSFFSRRAR